MSQSKNNRATLSQLGERRSRRGGQNKYCLEPAMDGSLGALGWFITNLLHYLRSFCVVCAEEGEGGFCVSESGLPSVWRLEEEK